jgi:hypothetical protein
LEIVSRDDGTDGKQSGTQTATSGNTPPSKPPRFVVSSNGSGASNTKLEKQQQQQEQQSQQHQQQQGIVNEDEWGQKLYGLQTGSALKRFIPFQYYHILIF